MGTCDHLEDKTITLVFGADMVNLTFVHFCAKDKTIAQIWAKELFNLVVNRNLKQISAFTTLLKAHTKLILTADKKECIPVKNIVKMFAIHKEDKKRVGKALDLSGFPSGKNDVILANSFTFEDFFTFYKNLTSRSEVEYIFNSMCDKSYSVNFITVSIFVDFLNKVQRDPRLNEILYPYTPASRAKDLIEEYEPNKFNAQRGLLSLDGFLRYLMSDDNPVITYAKYDLTDDMNQPLSHYFINSSHNTYLIGPQLTGKSAVEMYRQVLLSGCRCIELDFWNGVMEEPVVVHGYTFVPELVVPEVLGAIADNAFKVSDYPLILSFENHCNPSQQRKIAKYCREIFKEKLLDTPLESHKVNKNPELARGVMLPSPEMLKNKIIIKNKRYHDKNKKNDKKKAGKATNPAGGNGNGRAKPHPPTMKQSSKEVSRESSGQGEKKEGDNGNAEDENDSSEDSGSTSSVDDEEGSNLLAEETKLRFQGNPLAVKGRSRKETLPGVELSALVNYVTPVHFQSFEHAEKRNHCYEMSSFDEKQAAALLKERPLDFVNYNKNQLSRIYPSGTRFDSSNFVPQVFWNAGCQLVAINFQTLDLATQLNMGIFEYNQHCGYLLKPKCLRTKDRQFDPFVESTVDGIIAGSVSVHVLSGQFLTDKRVGVYVEVDMYGIPADTVKKRYRTRVTSNNGINPKFRGDPFVFQKVVLPDLAYIRIAAFEESGKMLGHRVLPITGLCPGYRHITLKNEVGQNLSLAVLFVHMVVKDYVPDDLSDFAEALANPIKFQSELDHRNNQLSILWEEAMEGDELTDAALLEAVEQFRRASKQRSVDHAPKLSKSNSLNGNAPGASSEVPSSSSGSKSFTQMLLITGIATHKELMPEPFEKMIQAKTVLDKKADLQKKLKSLEKKIEKEKTKLHAQRMSAEPAKKRFFSGNHFVKRLSLKNFGSSSDYSKGRYKNNEGNKNDEKYGTEEGKLTRCQAEKFMKVMRDLHGQQRDARQKNHDLTFAYLEKHMKQSHAAYLRIMRVLLEKDTTTIMSRLDDRCREECKVLGKNSRGKDEISRIKREIGFSLVEKGVGERHKLAEMYELHKDNLEKELDLIRERVITEKARNSSDILHDYIENMQAASELCGIKWEMTARGMKTK